MEFLCRSNMLRRQIALSTTLCSIEVLLSLTAYPCDISVSDLLSKIRVIPKPVGVGIKWDRPPKEFYSLQLTNRRNFPKTSVRAARGHAQSSLESRGSVHHSSRVVGSLFSSALRGSPSQGKKIITARVLPATRCTAEMIQVEPCSLCSETLQSTH